ncbi:MAG: DotA/TraY family protein [Alphaproteobacteria bacterium]
MSESKNDNKFSVGAFLFMPQFKYSFRAAAHIYPVFIQLLASVLVATEMLPKNHPAMRYGSADVGEFSFKQLIGEAWYHLRRKRATPRQWAMYFSILLMLFCFATAIVGITGRVFLGIGAAAQAQLFTLPGAVNTSVQNGMSASPSTLFDKRMDQAQMGGIQYNDWGLFMLDKIVRESAMTPQMGGRLQNAFSAIILTYNTAITVVAAVMIFWIILSVVVDTAKTGILGGGRHNMVWAPIRIVFALGLMIPLGSAGYSSGQYCVMKLAEWGSNLGTNGWTAYVNAMQGGNDFLAPVFAKGAPGLVNAVAEMRLCQVTYNAYVMKATQGASTTADPRQLVGARNTWSSDGGTLIHALTNNADAALCGALQIAAPGGASAVTFPGWSSAMAEPRMGDVPARATDNFAGGSVADDAAVIVAAVSYAAIQPLGYTAARTTLQGNSLANMAQAATFAAAQATLRQAVINGVIQSLTTGVEPLMLRFACAYSSRHVSGGGPIVLAAVDNDGTTPLCQGSFINACGAAAVPAPPGPANGNYEPDYRCHSGAINSLQGSLTTNLASGVSALLTWLTTPTAMNADMLQYGWASAGAFYNKITSMNTSVQSLSQPSITYSPGKLGSAAAQCTSSYSSVEDCRPSGINYETALVMQLYTKWYEEYSASGVGAITGTAGNTGMTTQGQQADKPNGMSMWSLGWGLIKGGASAVTSLIKTAIGIPDARDGLMVNLVGNVSDNTLPLANLAKTGVGLIAMGSGILILASILQGAIGLLTAATGTALANSAIFAFITGAASALITSGVMLTFFVPIMPFLRSAFATLTWMVSIFEAVVMIPIAALAHLTTEGEGLAAGARQCWVLWLNVLVRPILFVMGFIGAFIVYNAFICYFTTAYLAAAASSPLADNVVTAVLALIFNSAVYVGTCYAAANSIFKMVDIIPNALMRWMPGGSVDHSFDDGAQAAQGYAQSAAGQISRGIAAGAQDSGTMAGRAAMANSAYMSGGQVTTAGQNFASSMVKSGFASKAPPSGGGGAGGGGGVTGGGAGGGGSTPSDQRLKSDIHLLTKTDNGIKIYSFKYLGDDQLFSGVMAQDLLSDPAFSGAVSKDEQGFYSVNYAALGIPVINADKMKEAGCKAKQIVLEQRH